MTANLPSPKLAPLPDVHVFDGIEDMKLAPDHQTFPSGLSPIFAKLCAKHKPTRIIEVGSHKGGSAVQWCREGGPDCTVYCCDTWEESAEGFLVDPEKRTYQVLKKHGMPLTYFQFLTNMKELGLHNQIVPIPNTSAECAIILAAHKITAQIILIDASHTYRACYQDMCDYWPLLESGGSMIIDDMILYPDVYAAIMRFCAENSLFKNFEPVENNMFGLITKD